MTPVFIPVYRQRTHPKIYEERSVQGQINQIIPDSVMLSIAASAYNHSNKGSNTRGCFIFSVTKTG